MAVDHSQRKHALLSASGSSRWLNCTRSARLEEKFPSKSSRYADEGTLAHEYFEIEALYRLSRITKRVYNSELRKIKKNSLYAPEMDNYVDMFVTYIIEQFNIARSSYEYAEIHLETRLDFSHIVKGGFGTGDVLIISENVLQVIDLKYGKGVEVSAHENSQLKLYGIGALKQFEMLHDFETVSLEIFQPRITEEPSTFSLSVDDLEAWAENYVKPKADEASRGDGVFKPGEWCRFCKAKAVCRAAAEENLKVAKHEFKNPELLEDFEIAEILGKIDVIKNWIKAVSDHALSEAIKGKAWEGFKLVRGKSNRKWVDEKKAISILKDLGYKPSEYIVRKLNTITSIESLLGKADFYNELKDCYIKPDGAPTLVDKSDKRSEIVLDCAKTDFAEPLEG